MIIAGLSPAWATVYTSTDVPVGICDLCTVSSTLTVGDSFTITSPLRTVVMLSNRAGGSGDNFIDTRFDDGTGIAIGAGSALRHGFVHSRGLAGDV